MPQLRIPAVYLRGGSSRGVFFHAHDLPPAGSGAMPCSCGNRQPDPYGKQIDGLGGATSSTSKVVVIAPSCRRAGLARVRIWPADLGKRILARVPRAGGVWQVAKASMSRSARQLMEGWRAAAGVGCAETAPSATPNGCGFRLGTS